MLDADVPEAAGEADASADDEGDLSLSGRTVGEGVANLTDGSAAALIDPNKNIIDNSANINRLALIFIFIFFSLSYPVQLEIIEHTAA